MRLKLIVLGALAVVALSGCAEAQPVPTETVVGTETVEVTVTPTPEPTPSESPTVEPAAPAGTESLDRTGDVRAIAGDQVVRAVEDAPGQFTVWTSITDPRGDNGSPQAQAALAICEAVQQQLGATHVRVQESDESTFVVLGGSFADCTEA